MAYLYGVTNLRRHINFREISSNTKMVSTDSYYTAHSGPLLKQLNLISEKDILDQKLLHF